MVLGWFQTPMSRDRGNSFSGQVGAQEPTSVQANPSGNITVNQAEPQTAQPPRRLSIFERRVSLGSDPFSREYADQMEDMWVAECEQGDCAHVSKGHLRAEALTRPVALGTDEFSREYFDSTGDTFVAETELGDSGFLRRNSQAIDMEQPDILRRLGEILRQPVRVGRDTFSQEYARESGDLWQAKAGHGPSGVYLPGQITQRVMNEYKPEDGTDWSKIYDAQEQERARRRSIFTS